MDTDDDMAFVPDADPSGSGGPPDGGPPDPQAEDQPEDRRDGDRPVDTHTGGHQTGALLQNHRGGHPPDEPPGADITENIWRWIVYLKKKEWFLESERRINKLEIGNSAAVATKTRKELDIAKFEAGKLSGVVTKQQR